MKMKKFLKSLVLLLFVKTFRKEIDNKELSHHVALFFLNLTRSYC